MKKGDHLFLVDGSGYIFRAYHALPPLNRKSDGLPTGAVLGFCNMVWKLIQDARNTDVGVVPTHFAVIFDYSSKTFRNELYAEYKANRSAPPEDLIPQFGLIRQATKAFNLPCIEMDGFEADDLIATYARLACEAGGDTTIISSDKDLMQLVGATVSMYDPMKDRQIGIPEVVEKWGVPPEKMIDLQALTGDLVDNVPACPASGPKTAAQLLEQFGDLDTLLARAGEIKQDKRRQSIIDNADKARISRDLVTLKNDVPVADGLDDFVLHPPNGPKLIAFLKTMEFSSLTRRVAEATGTEPAEIEPAVVAVEHGRRAWAGCRCGRASLWASRLATIPALRRRTRRKQPGPPGPSPRADTPAALATARAQAAAWRPKSTATAYECIRDHGHATELDCRGARGGHRRIPHGNARRSTRCEPNRSDSRSPSGRAASAYVPVAHRSSAADLLGGGRAENQISLDEALAALKPLLMDRVGAEDRPQSQI